MSRSRGSTLQRPITSATPFKRSATEAYRWWSSTTTCGSWRGCATAFLLCTMAKSSHVARRRRSCRIQRSSKRIWGANMSVLELCGVGVRYGNIVGTDNVSLRLMEGRVIALVGANGAGKSSTLKAIMGMAGYPSGDILLDGISLKSLKPSQIVQKGISLSPEGRRVFSAMTVHDNLRVAGYSRAGMEFDADLERVFSHFPRLRERSKQR